jgi:UDPglucose 6-dehydrogenase
LCEKLNIEYSAVAHYVTEDPRIGDSHSFITEERGFGGHCFPKDTSAIVETAEQYGVDLTLIKEAIKYNDRIKK